MVLRRLQTLHLKTEAVQHIEHVAQGAGRPGLASESREARLFRNLDCRPQIFPFEKGSTTRKSGAGARVTRIERAKGFDRNLLPAAGRGEKYATAVARYVALS